MRARGAMPSMTPFITPAKLSEVPKSVVSVIGEFCIIAKLVVNPVRYYFDHNATTPVSQEVLEALVPAMAEVYGNASSIHHEGQMAKQRLEMARRQAAGLLHCDAREVVFL